MATDDDKPIEPAATTAENDGDEWEVLPLKPELADHQFGLIGLFGLLTAAGIYFWLERVHQGQFGLHMLGGVVLLVGAFLPALWFVLWLVRTIFNGASMTRLLAALAIVTGMALAAVKYWRP